MVVCEVCLFDGLEGRYVRFVVDAGEVGEVRA